MTGYRVPQQQFVDAVKHTAYKYFCTTLDDGLRTETYSGGNRGVKRIVALSVS
jgi:hypothetical protein